MEVNYIDKLNHFIEEHNSFLKNKAYLQKSDYYKLVRNHGETLSQIDKNRQQISEKAYYIIKKILSDPKLTWIDKLNEQYISKKLIDEKEYLDTIFTKYQIPIILDEEQRKAIVSDEDASLIIAGAGTGKTTTMAAKVKYLVEQQHISPEEILVLSYTKKAVGELKRQIQEIFQIPAEITTFHSLGYNILSKKYQSKLIVYNEFKQQKIICKYVKEELFSNKQKMNLAISLYPECFGKKLKANFDHFKDFESYFNFYKNERYNEEVKKGIEEFIQNKKMAFMFQEHPKGLDLQTYKSKKEVSIANFLYENGIDNYEYEKPAPFVDKEGHPYCPDFTLEINGKKTIIEYFGLTKYQKNGLYDQKEIERYNEERKLKEELSEKYKIDHIFLEGEDTTKVLRNLKEELIKRGVILKRRDPKEIFFHILDDFIDVEFREFSNTMIKTIDKLKENCAKENTFDEIISFYDVNKISPEDFKWKKQNINLIHEIFNYYQKNLKKGPNPGIDFADMIIGAYEFLKVNPKNKTFPRYKYLLIDEYQDISFSRFLLTRQIVSNFKTKIIAVGDDWQTIYTFAGSNIKLFYNFKQQFPNSKEYQITHTYRNSQQLIDLAGEFVLKNEEQIKKQLVSSKHCENPIEIVYHEPFLQIETICKILDRIYEQNPNDLVFILSRRNVSISALTNTPYFKLGPQNTIYYLKYPNMKIEALTVHSAKGLTCDQAIVIDLLKGVFPSDQMEKNLIYLYYKRTNIWEEAYPYAEERRLFYVALTRTKNKVYLISPIRYKEQSIFVQEIRKEQNVIENKDYLTELLETI